MKLSSRQVLYRLAYAVFTALILAEDASGTVIYVRITQEDVVIAADSKELYPYGNAESHATVIEVCKIRRSEDVYFASAGIGGDQNEGFDVRQVAAQAMRYRGDLQGKAEEFQRLIKTPLIKILEVLRKQDLTQYKKFLLGAPLITVFVRVEDRSLTFLANEVTFIETSQGSIELNQRLYKCPGACRLPTTVPIGSSQRADELELQAKDFWERGSVNGVRELMMASIADRPDEAGGPINILRLTKTGAEWVEGNKSCREKVSLLK